MKLAIVVAVALVSLVATVASKPDKLVCYYGGWVVYRPGDGKYDIENIDPNLCTHVIYSFVGLDTSGEIKVLDPWIDLPDNWGKDGFGRFNSMKKINPDLKTLIAIGGWNEGSVKYSETFAIPAKRAVFVKSSVDFLKKYNFDGLDLDWEYPNQRGGKPEDVDNFSKLLQELRVEFDKYGYLLTAAVAAAETSFTQSYDVPKLGQYLHFINIMTYDFHGAWEKETGLNSPLYMSKIEEGTSFAGFNTDASIQAWMKYGAPASKVILGVGLYGRSFTIIDQNCITPRCPTSGPGAAGQFTREAGMLGYNEICLAEAGAKKMWDDEAQVPYMSWGNQWVGYDDERSAKLKVDYIKKYNLGGGMVWSVDTDDFHGKCGKGKNPLMTVLNRELGITQSGTTTPDPITTTTEDPGTGPTEEPGTTEEPTTTTTPAPTAPPPTPSPTDVCKFEGFNRDPYDCAVFYRCWIYEGQYEYMKFECGPGLWFDPDLIVCNFPSAVDCTPQTP
ncbi:chitinase-3-like protein 1 [Arctopsyche grandis]|uniref:chitinase-3-like protein 1 n=1 Tax=Arctopsyche grandis TaxID=121162 RepID=UPI00406D9C7D